MPLEAKMTDVSPNSALATSLGGTRLCIIHDISEVRLGTVTTDLNELNERWGKKISASSAPQVNCELV